MMDGLERPSIPEATQRERATDDKERARYARVSRFAPYTFPGDMYYSSQKTPLSLHGEEETGTTYTEKQAGKNNLTR